MEPTDRASILARNLASVQERIAAAARRAGRNIDDITLVAVTKSVSSDVARSLVQLGVADIGENRVQSLLAKHADLADEAVRFHLIGHLQENKINKIIGRVHLFHALDRFSLIDALASRLARAGKTLSVLLEVNIAGEVSKHGFAPAEVERAVEEVLSHPELELKGLMAMAPLVEPEKTRPYCARMKALFDKLQGEVGSETFTILSLGMSNDFEIAIEEGSTMVRIGTALFEGVV
jgi:pyridoxal phosphate enzyme (YggS family)